MYAGYQTDSTGGRRPDRYRLYIAQDNPGAADRLLDEIEENREPARRCFPAPLRW